MSLLIPLMNWIEKMADFSIFKQKYKQYEDTLKNTSYDKDNDEYLCSKENKVINFDTLSLKFNKEKGKKRVDALFEKNKELFLVEFKNQKQSDIKKEDISSKFKDSLNLLERLFNELNLSFRDFEICLYLAMKDVKVYGYKRHCIGQEIECRLQADENLKRFKNIKCAPKKSFLEEYEEIFK